MTIQYKNSVNDIITQSQANLLERFKKEYVDNGNIKKVEEFKQATLDAIIYYKDSSEDETGVIKDLVNSAPANFFSIIEQTVLPSNLIISNSKNYKPDGSVIVQHRSLYNSDNTVLCTQPIDHVTCLPVIALTEKFYYNDSIIEVFPAFVADYNADGTLNYIEYNPYHEYDSENFSLANITELRDMLGFTQAEMDYYLTADFMP